MRKCAATARHYAAHGEACLARPAETEARLSHVQFAARTLLAIMPWNFPFWQVFRFLIPAVLAGNTALVKHAENMQGCAEAIEEVVRDAGGATLLRNIAVDRDDVGRFIADRRIRAVTLTGSVRAGRSGGAAAGAAGKKAVLELGGSDPFIVLAGADLERTLPIAVDLPLRQCRTELRLGETFPRRSADRRPLRRGLCCRRRHAEARRPG